MYKNRDEKARTSSINKYSMCLECFLFSPSSLLVVFIFYNLSRSYCSKSCLISLFISFNLLFIDIFFSGFEDYESKHFIPYFKLFFFCSLECFHSVWPHKFAYIVIMRDSKLVFFIIIYIQNSNIRFTSFMDIWFSSY